MELRHLRYFIAVAEELNFSRAARRLHIAQPPLSQQIKRLERELGVDLLQRNSRGVRLTSAGEMLLAEAYTTLAAADRIAPRVLSAHQGATGHVTIGCVPVGFAGLIPAIVRPFRNSHPGVDVTLRELNTVDQYDALDTNQIDLGIVRTGVQAPRLTTRTILEERLLVALPTGHHIDRRPRVSLADLRDEDFIFFSRQIGKWHFDQLVQLCQDQGAFSPAIVSQCESILTQLGMVASGLGVALVTELTAQLNIPGITYRSLEGLDVPIPLVAVWSPVHQSPVREHLLSWLATSNVTDLLADLA